MWKKIGVATVAAVAIAGAGSPAFADTHAPRNWGPGGGNSQIGLGNTGDIDFLHGVSGALGLCGDDAAVLAGVVPLLSPNPTKGCTGSGILGGGSHN